MPKHHDPYEFTGEGMENKKKEIIAEFIKTSTDPADKYPNDMRPAFPTNNRMFAAAQGLTKREYFAAMAMQGWLACQHEGFSSSSPEDLAVRAVNYADALLKELETLKQYS